MYIYTYTRIYIYIYFYIHLNGLLRHLLLVNHIRTLLKSQTTYISLIFRHVLKKEAIPGDSRKQSTSHQCENPSSSPHWENRFLILNSPSSPGKDIDVCAKEGTCWGKSEGGKRRGEEERRWDKWECFVWLLLRKDTDCGAV